MYLNRQIDRRIGQRGFSLPVAVFVIVIMALLAVGIVQLSSRSNISATQEELANRAFYAAESGASWAMSRLFFNTLGPATRAYSDAGCDGLGGPPVFATQGLATCTVSLSCSCPGLANCAAQAIGLTNYYRITSTGICGTGQVQGIRTIEIGAKNEP